MVDLKTAVQAPQIGQSQSLILTLADLLLGWVIWWWLSGRGQGGGGSGAAGQDEMERVQITDYDHSMNYGISMGYGK